MTSVDLTITSRFAGGDSVKNQVSARYSLRDIGYNDEKGSPSETFREARLTYKIPITEGEPPVAESFTLKLDREGNPLEARLHRPGAGMRLDFICGQSSRTRLDTPAGALEITVRTDRLEGSCKGAHVQIKLQYELTLGTDAQGRTVIEYSGDICS